MLITIIATVVVLGVLIFVHELGHFLTAKAVGIEVPRFSIGLGPKAFGFRWGETEYVISWLPLGGYVKMAGMEEMERIEGGADSKATGVAGASDLGLVTEEPRGPGPRDFESKSLGARALVLSAGVIMNALFAFVAFSALALFWGVERSPEARIARVAEEKLPPGTEVLTTIPPGALVVAVGEKQVGDWNEFRQALLTAAPGPSSLHFEEAPAVTVSLPADDSARVQLALALEQKTDAVLGLVRPGLPAEKAGLRAGDRILSAGGKNVTGWQDFVAVIVASPEKPVPLVVQRAGRNFETTVVPVSRKAEGGDEGEVIGWIGVASDLYDEPGLGGSIAHGARQTWYWVATTVGFLGDLVTGGVSPRNLGGPILIGQVSGRVARAGLDALLNFMAIFSINLAVLNLLPIPVLDGGHLMFLVIEGVRGRALSIEQRMRLTQVGFVIVVAIMVWALANDVLRLFGL